MTEKDKPDSNEESVLEDDPFAPEPLDDEDEATSPPVEAESSSAVTPEPEPEPETKSEADEKPAVKDEPTPAPSKPRRGLALVAGLALLIASGAVAGGLYLFGEVRELRNAQAARVVNQQEELAAMDVRPQITSLQGRVDALDQSMNESFDVLYQQQSDTQAGLANLQEVSVRTDRAWTLTETRYLLKMAQHRLALAGDLDTAAAALRAADAQLHSLADINLLPIREALAEEIALIRAAPKPDIEGTVLSLIHLARRSNQIPLISQRKRAQIAEATPVSAEPTEPGDFSTEFVKFVNQFIVVRAAPATDNTDPPERAAEALGKRAELQVALQKAQVAALRRDQTDFVSAVQLAKSLVAAYFDIDNDVTLRFVEDLHALEESPVRASVSGIGGALVKLEEFVAESEESL
ncbi:MAG: uroporphyrinogen-III C-methyltransferase [Pseudomonadota bacterium]